MTCVSELIPSFLSRAAAVAAGASRYLTKPFDPRALVADTLSLLATPGRSE